MKKTIGIDLGTTNSCVSVIEGGKAVIIPNDQGNRTTPSVVAFTRDGERLVGEIALRQKITNPQRTVTSVKRHMGTDWRINIDGKSFSAQEISAMILRKLRKDAENYLGEEITDAVITVPAYFNDIQRQATKDAGRIAGLNVKRIINEPTSASLAYGLNGTENQKVMVFDLGGGTFDVSVIELVDDVIEVLATCGDNHLGGDDFDKCITDFLLNEFQRENHIDLRKDQTALRRIQEAAEQAKKELSVSASTEISLPYISQNKNGAVHFSYTLSRTKFNELTKELVERTAIPVRNALTDAGIAPTELNRVLLVGGSTRIPAVQDMVKKLTGMEPSKNINPDECVAQGAAIQGDTLSGGYELANFGGGLLLLDVTPLSLSIETVGGIATRLVERNSTLPVHYSQIFTTASPFQRSVEIHVLQGERPMAKDNKTIGKFTLKGIKKAPAGVPQIEVTFDIDANGILKVSAKDIDTGKAQSITITESGNMSDAEIERAVRDAEEYAVQDSIRRSAFETTDSATRLISRVEQALGSSGKQIPKEQKKIIKSNCNSLKKLLVKYKAEQLNENELMEIKASMERLENSAENLLNMKQ